MKRRLRRFGARWPWMGRALDVQDRVGEVNGGFAASAVTVTLFLAIFLLLLVVIAAIGFVAANDDELAANVIDALGLTGPGAEIVTSSIQRAADSRQAASIIGLLGLAWAGSAVAVALQQAIRIPWQERSEGIKDRLVGMAWLAVATVGFALALAMGGVLNDLPSGVPAPLAAGASVLFGLAIEAALFVWMFWGLGTRRVGWRPLVPGALVAAAGFEVLRLVGTVVVPRMVAHSTALWGSIGTVFALLAWIALFARLLVYASTLNAVRHEAAHGSVAVPIQVPRLPGVEPVAATRGGTALDEAALAARPA
ncbi:MAG: YihY/virulence factor BrkB family protein [Acidimicrobiales bacterium]